MLKLPQISFVVTSYNYAKYIENTLESIKSQTYTDYEIIIVDDCSNDNSQEIIERFISDNQDLKITFVKNDKNIGQLGSMIRGLKESRGQFISFIDSDDILLPDYAKNHIRVHLETSVAFTSCQIIEIGDENEIHTLYSNASPHCKNLETLFAGGEVNYEVLRYKRFGGWYWSPNSSAMFRKASIDYILDYKNFEKWRICPDKFLFNFAHLIGGSALIYVPLIAYRRHKNNAGNSTYVTGDRRLHSDMTTKINLKNNIKLRPEIIQFLFKEKDKLGYRNLFTILLKVIF